MRESDIIFYNSHQLDFKAPFGAAKCGDVITIRLEINAIISYSSNNSIEETTSNIDKVILMTRINDDEYCYDMEFEKIIDNRIIYKYSFKAPDVSNILFYYFQICFQNRILYYGNNKLCLGGVGEIYENNPVPYQITVYSKGLETPNWFKHSVIYQIFVDRFYNGNEEKRVLNAKKNSFLYGNWEDEPCYIKDDSGKVIRWEFYGGNLQGIIKKLDYLEDLGVNLLYLNPIFESRSNHKYDTANYMNIDPMFGNDEIFKKLIEKAKEKGIYIILDGVFSHTGSDSVYFNKYNNYNSIGAYQSKDSPYYKWYNFENYPDKYECWWGVEDLPNVNELNSSYLDYIILNKNSIINHWMDFGIKGWRLDVADELPDEFIVKLKKVCIEKDKESVVIGEVWEDASNKISYGERRRYFIDKELDSVTNYSFRDNLLEFFSGKINAQILHRKFMSMYENYPLHNFYSIVNLISSHDIERIYTMVKELVSNNEALAFKYLNLITIIQYTFPGVPLLYYGDEAGVEGFKDPLNRKTYPWGKENLEILNLYKKNINIRNNYIVLRTGNWKSIYFHEDVYGYVRSIKNNKDVFNVQQENCTMLIFINRSLSKEYDISIYIEEALGGKIRNILNFSDEVILTDKYAKINLKPLEGKIYMEKIY